MSNKKVILFDIDYTLFNARVYRDLFLKKIFEVSGETDWNMFLEQEEEVYQGIKKKYGYFKPEPFFPALEEKFHKKFVTDELRDIFYNKAILEQSTYEETLEVLQTLAKKENIILGIFSAGIEKMQLSKIEPVIDFLHKEHIHIFAFSKKHALENVLKKYTDDKIFLIDDILEILYNAKKLRADVTTVWIKRGPYKNKQEVQEQIDRDGFSPDYTIDNLEEVLAIVK